MNTQKNISQRRLKDYLFLALASSFGLGLLPLAPGTFGALLGVGIHILSHIAIPQSFQLIFLSLSFLAVCNLHFSLTPWAINYWREKDPRHFVLDEIAGYLVVPILFRPQLFGAPTPPFWKTLALGFIFFRILDIIKIPPARQIDRDMEGGWGILLDDLVSAVYAATLLYILVIIKII
jgi:phosphatidylglycerophosphatase A